MKEFLKHQDNQISQVQYSLKPQYDENALSSESFQYDKVRNIAQVQHMIKSWKDLIDEKDGKLTDHKHRYGKGGLIQDMIIGSGHRVQYHYDEAGCVVKKIEHKNGFREQVWHYEWDAKNRLILLI